MKNHLFFAFFLFLTIGKIYGQKVFEQNSTHCSGDSIDSVYVNFVSIEENFLNVTLVADKWNLTLFKKKYNSHYLAEDILIYQTNSFDTIDYLFSRVRIILKNPPIYDSGIVVYDCCDGMTISVFEHNNKCDYQYTLYPRAYFPFAYTELYSYIRQIIAKYCKEE